MAKVAISDLSEQDVSVLLDALDTKLRSINVTGHRSKSRNLLTALDLDRKALDSVKAKLLSLTVLGPQP